MCKEHCSVLFHCSPAEDMRHKCKYTITVLCFRDRHRDIRDGFDRLHRIAAKGPKSEEFVEPKVQGLWKLALETDFTPDELESLKVELLHYEKRLLKLRHLQPEAALGNSHKKKMGNIYMLYIYAIRNSVELVN